MQHFADADDLLLVAGVIEEELVALLHLLEMAARGEIAHAGPGLALGATLDLIVPGKILRFGLQQPVSHVPSPSGSNSDQRAGIDQRPYFLDLRVGDGNASVCPVSQQVPVAEPAQSVR